MPNNKLRITKISFFLISIFCGINFCSCNNETLSKFEIVNTTNERIDSFHILPDNIKHNFIQIEPNTKSLYNTNMTRMPKVDGSYMLSFKSKTRHVFIPFGYYSNGYPMESLTKIFIHPDTVIIKPEYKSNY